MAGTLPARLPARTELPEQLAQQVAAITPGGYHPGAPAAAEPTAWATMALIQAGKLVAAEKGCRWLAELQARDGSVGVSRSQPSPHGPPAWPCWLGRAGTPRRRTTVRRSNRPRTGVGARHPRQDGRTEAADWPRHNACWWVLGDEDSLVAGADGHLRSRSLRSGHGRPPTHPRRDPAAGRSTAAHRRRQLRQTLACCSSGCCRTSSLRAWRCGRSADRGVGDERIARS